MSGRVEAPGILAPVASCAPIGSESSLPIEKLAVPNAPRDDSLWSEFWKFRVDKDFREFASFKLDGKGLTLFERFSSCLTARLSNTL